MFTAQCVASFCLCQDRPKSILFPFSSDCSFPPLNWFFLPRSTKNQSQVSQSSSHRSLEINVSGEPSVSGRFWPLPCDSFLPRSAENLRFTSNLSAQISRLILGAEYIRKSNSRLGKEEEGGRGTCAGVLRLLVSFSISRPCSSLHRLHSRWNGSTKPTVNH